MRFGVTGKILLAWGVLIAAFVGYAAFTVTTLHRTRERVVANQAFLDVERELDRALSILYSVSLPAGAKPEQLGPQAFRNAAPRLGAALATIDAYKHSGADVDDAWRRALLELRQRVHVLRARLDELAGALGAAQATTDDAARADFLRRLELLKRDLATVRREVAEESKGIGTALAADESTSLELALSLGLGGAIAAAGLAFVIARTLRPLGILRGHAKEIAAGDYARRTGLASRDEIGDLAREFDAMAAAIQEREQRLIRSERLATVGRLAAQITHEIRNPLASLGLSAELLGDELQGASGDADEARRLLATIASEVDRLTEITETYLRFARLPRPQLEREDLASIVGSVMEFARAELSQAGVSLELVIAPSLPDVACDESQIRQALLNLVRNAREAMPGGGRLRVEVAASGGSVRVSIEDSAPGIAPEHLPKIFDPFFSTKERGTGLGLPLVQQIIAEHGGRIDVASEVGRGTKFIVSLPGLAAAPEASVKVEEQEPPTVSAAPVSDRA